MSLKIFATQPSFFVSLLFEDAPDEPEHLHRFAVVPSAAQDAPLIVTRCSKWSLDGGDAYCSIESLLGTCDA